MLSYSSELKVSLPEFMTGTSRFQAMNKLLSVNAEWRKEAFYQIRNMLLRMFHYNASDMEIGGFGANESVWYRIYGIKKPVDEFGVISNDEASILLLSMLTDEQKVELLKNKNIDLSLGIKLKDLEAEARFRCDIYYENNSLAGSFRKINQKLFPLESLGFTEPILKRLCLSNEKRGLILITGITGSGKSSTLDAIINMNNSISQGHIIIIGNPIEYIHKSNNCIVRHREVGEDVLNFKSGAREALRQDPDIIVVGEMRDPDTMSMVIEVTDSGHKVFSTMHTSSAIESIHRIIGEFPPEEQERIRLRLADTLSVVISQKLVPNVNNQLTLAKEILSVNASVVAAIKNNNVSEVYQMITEGKKQGMISIEQDLYNLYKNGIITKETAINYSNNKNRIQQLLLY
ncbi:MAG: Flp pilus assembly complex ATPase component TadA [Candidatus Cloacimonetes bacterium]|nr:Flp pilus assembly complex ATPase component TadA [Candidatus Cloacimonadota bacterium]